MKVNKEEIQQKAPFLVANENKVTMNFSSKVKNVLLIPGASHISKCYPEDKFIELTRIFDANFFLIWCSQKKKYISRRFNLVLEEFFKNVVLIHK